MEPLPDDAAKRTASLPQADLCDACLGRTVARLGHGLTNAERGRTVRGAEPAPSPADCTLCQGLSAQADRVADLAIRAAEGLDHGSHMLGCRVDDEIEEREQRLWADHGFQETGEPLRTQLTREAGKRFGEAIGSVFDPEAPELTVIVDTRFWAVETEIASLYVQGRYRKLERGIPQTRWHCRACQGDGCVECDLTGKQYATSVEELIGAPMIDAYEARDAVLHGQGREDVDARMLGTGRPFVMELKRPWRRDADLEDVTATVADHADGRVEVQDLRYVDGDAVQKVKEARSRKGYRVHVSFAAPVEGEKLKSATRALEGTISQRTPSRVVHRRADRTRSRDVHRCQLRSHDADTAVLTVRGDAGLYIKELMTGDDGRTTPSLAELLGADVHVEALDVIAVEG